MALKQRIAVEKNTLSYFVEAIKLYLPPCFSNWKITIFYLTSGYQCINVILILETAKSPMDFVETRFEGGLYFFDVTSDFTALFIRSTRLDAQLSIFPL